MPCGVRVRARPAAFVSKYQAARVAERTTSGPDAPVEPDPVDRDGLRAGGKNRKAEDDELHCRVIAFSTGQK